MTSSWFLFNYYNDVQSNKHKIMLLFAHILCIQKATYVRSSSSVNGSESMCWKLEKKTIHNITGHPVLTSAENKLPTSLLLGTYVTPYP